MRRQDKQSVLLTGGAGFIGSHIVERLLQTRNYRITIIDDFNESYDPAVKHSNLEGVLDDPNVHLLPSDILDSAANDTLNANKFDAIIHLAARTGVRPSLNDPALYERVNVEGTYRMLELARAHKVKKFVFASSSSVYGTRLKGPFAETDRLDQPESPYAATKIGAEAACHVYSRLYDIPMVCLRFFTVFGPRQRPDLAIHKFMKLMVDSKPVPLFGDGSSARDYTYIDDIVDGVIASLSYEGSPFEVINLGGEHPTKLIDLVSLLGAVLKVQPRVQWLPNQPGDVPITWSDSTKAKRLLGFKPRIETEDGLARFASWFLEQNEEEYRSGRFAWHQR